MLRKCAINFKCNFYYQVSEVKSNLSVNKHVISSTESSHFKLYLETKTVNLVSVKTGALLAIDSYKLLIFD